jgi:hypothetical protein
MEIILEACTMELEYIRISLTDRCFTTDGQSVSPDIKPLWDS